MATPIKKKQTVSALMELTLLEETDIKYILCRGLQLIGSAGIATSHKSGKLSDEVTFEQRLEGSEGVSRLKLFGRRAC